MSKENSHLGTAPKGAGQSKSAYFDIIREQLQFWPYTIHQIDDTLDAGLIEARAKQLLFRAIHSRNLTAFVGSGLSMSYGRLDWRTWETEQNRTVTKQAELFLNLCEAALNWQKILIPILNPHLGRDGGEDDLGALIKASGLWKLLHEKDAKPCALPQMHKHNVWQWLRGRERAIEAAQNRISKLKSTFDLIKDKPGRFPGGEEMPVKFEIAQQLHNELRSRSALFLPPDPTKTSISFQMLPIWGWAGAYFEDRTDAPADGLGAYRAFLFKRGVLDEGALKDKVTELQEAYREALNAFCALSRRPEAQLDFETLAKTLLVDECPHAAILLRKGLLKNKDRDDASLVDGEDEKLTWLERELGVFGRNNQRRDIKGIREDEGRYRVLTPFTFARTQILIDQAEAEAKDPAWQSYMQNIQGELDAYLETTSKAGIKRTYLTPSSRYLTALALALLQDPFKALGLTQSGSAFELVGVNGPGQGGPSAREEKFNAQAGDPGHPLGPPPVDGFTGRRSILAERFDPMPKIHGDLKINRFITTNYDFEIERYFQDHGFRRFDPPPSGPHSGPKTDWPQDSDMRLDELGRVLRDRCFTPDQAAQLTSFAMSPQDRGAEVMHLHGRATKKDELVITERDYMRLYLTDDEQRPTIDEGIQVAFSGGPLLFLGLGMEETDLLRPLRQFISNRDRTVGYTSIALLPAEKALPARAKFSASLYMRYGVHTVFYGSGQLTYLGIQEEDEQGGMTPRKFPLDWLHRIIELCNGLRDELSKWEEEEVPTGRSNGQILRDLIDKVRDLTDDLASGEDYPAKASALLVLLDQSQDANVEDLANRLSRLDRHTGEQELEKPRLRTCDFAPTRPSKHRLIHRHEAGTVIDGDLYVGFYTRQLDRLLTMILQLPDTLGGTEDAEQRKAHCAPIRIALDGLHGAFITGTLNAALEGINQEKRGWWQSWQASPNHRLAEFQRLLPGPSHGSAAASTESDTKPTGSVDVVPLRLGSVLLRHKLDNVLTPMTYAQTATATGDLLEKDASPARLAAPNRTHIRSFDTFVAAAASTFKHRHVNGWRVSKFRRLVQLEKTRRQLITVAARRGMGKGTFMSAFATRLGQSTYTAATWPTQDVDFAASIHINLGFSPEIASAYDMLQAALISVIVSMELGIVTDEDVAAKKEEYAAKHATHVEEVERLSRNAALKSLFEKFRAASRSHKPGGKTYRLLINICSVELLFDSLGHAKNREIRNFLDLLTSPDLHDCPMDVVFVADDGKLGGMWREPEGASKYCRRYMDRDGLGLFAEEQIRRALMASQIVMDEPVEASRQRLSDPKQVSGVEDFANWDGTSESLPENHFIHFTRPVNTAWLLIDNFKILALALHLLNPPKPKDSNLLDGAKDRFSEAVVCGRQRSDQKMDRLWQRKVLPDAEDTAKCRRLVEQYAMRSVRTALRAHANTVVGYPQGHRGKLDMALRHRLKPEVNKNDADQWRSVRRGLGNSRFSLTLLLAAAENTIVHAGDPMDGAKRAEKLLLETVARVRTVGQERRDQLVLETVLETYRAFHQIGSPDLDVDLHLLIIKNLGVIGTPIGSAVLVRLGGIRDYFSRIGIEPEISRRRFIVRALTTMAHRGLVFRLDPHPRLVEVSRANPNQDWDADQEFRYALHRVVQSYALTALEAGPQEPVTSNRFMPTLYAAMPSQGPTLSRKSYRLLRALMIGLSQYPDVPAKDDSAEPWLFTTKDTAIKVQAARAAVSLARNNFSVAVVSRLAVHDPISKGVHPRGYLETYRVRLRWLIRIAYELSHERDVKDPGGNVKGPHDQINVLYRDEIVWLYNELGVIAFAQGALSDALGYLRQAAEANEDIEGQSRAAPIYNHIDLNHAIVQMERGQFASARRRLQMVKEANSENKYRLYHLACGYEAVLDNLQSRGQGLAERFRKVTTYFQNNHEDRAAAIFLLHRARNLSRTNGTKAIELVERARTLAHVAGHEDIRHHADLVGICVRLINAGPSALTLRDQRILHRIENFSRRMAIWNLSVETLHVRAQILIAQNEHVAAGRHLTRAMAISKRHDMNLRLNCCMTTYARVLLLRGDYDGAAGVAAQSLERAKRTGYALETSRAQEVIRECEIGLEQDMSQTR